MEYSNKVLISYNPVIFPLPCQSPISTSGILLLVMVTTTGVFYVLEQASIAPGHMNIELADAIFCIDFTNIASRLSTESKIALLICIF